MNKGYMMATKASHLLGDISSDEPDLCFIEAEDAENYIGKWAQGWGFANVKFPKTTTRELTPDEEEKYKGKVVRVGSEQVYPL